MVAQPGGGVAMATWPQRALVALLLPQIVAGRGSGHGPGQPPPFHASGSARHFGLLVERSSSPSAPGLASHGRENHAGQEPSTPAPKRLCVVPRSKEEALTERNDRETR
ncbi:uncharacterized protein E0L32_005141 [Thyridium curvatum]|uniref:Secreted protein n=1 Tax=Thyridium curvatum TaxID=1093900 RepID=A0A507B6L2_9PEZI|nr:uncharacterized protein E0L32_005141 [Thyridium curvatum]TPX14746.1 hypothetical protein E0L32_005141 [Thyridium curvatum]